MSEWDDFREGPGITKEELEFISLSSKSDNPQPSAHFPTDKQPKTKPAVIFQRRTKLETENAKLRASLGQCVEWMTREVVGPFIVAEDDYKCRFCLQRAKEVDMNFPHSSSCSLAKGNEQIATARKLLGKEN